MMHAVVYSLQGVQILACSADGKQIENDRDAMDLIGEALAQRADMILIPTGRLHHDFFCLRTGVAGAILQKFVNYQRRVAVVGDVSQYAANSESFRDFVREANRGAQIWFVADNQELEDRLRKDVKACR